MTTDVRLRIVVTNPPTATYAIFGLQDKAGDVRLGTPRSAHSVVFECEVTASDRSDGPGPNFLGPYTHGSPKARFLYVSHGTRGGAGWIKRIKIPLSSISWSMIEEARGGPIAADVDGRASGTVPANWRPGSA